MYPLNWSSHAPAGRTTSAQGLAWIGRVWSRIQLRYVPFPVAVRVGVAWPTQAPSQTRRVTMVPCSYMYIEYDQSGLLCRYPYSKSRTVFLSFPRLDVEIAVVSIISTDVTPSPKALANVFVIHCNSPTRILNMVACSLLAIFVAIHRVNKNGRHA